MDFLFDPRIIYLTVNFLVTLVWFTIPWWVNAHRKKYDLPPKRVWPIPIAVYKDMDLDSAVIYSIVGGFFIATIPIIVGYVVIYRGLYKPFRWCIMNIAFSKEEKVQIAVGSIEKEKNK